MLKELDAASIGQMLLLRLFSLQHMTANVLIKNTRKRRKIGVNEEHSLLVFIPDAQPVIYLALSNPLLGEPPWKSREITSVLTTVC